MSAAQQQPGPSGPHPPPWPPSRPAAASGAARPGLPPETFRSTTALVVWWVWAVFAAANLIDLAVQDRDHFAATVAAILLLITGVAFVVGFCPKIVADDDGLTIRNPLRGHRVPWTCVDSMELGDSLELHCVWQDGGTRRKKLYGWAVHSPRRSRLKTELRARRKVSAEEKRSEVFGRLPPEAREAMMKTEAEHIVASLQNRADRAQAARTGAAEPGEGRVVSRWDWLAVAAIVLPAVLLTVVALL